ncbi:cytochrome P450 [Actinomadura sp. DC4]|uniref:cytochrome P450 n=1 Tax=Actinomadura sp. DC4 TaxID=3055069 RepID=UPI0025AEE895|nr:cytochrome P450 [Actinomadura sp. DC4]MDN3353320.1 cytochrome P450 [Actinomadura sp. DC4]
MSPLFASLPGVVKVRLHPSGEEAWLVQDYDLVQYVLRSSVFSRELANLRRLDGFPPLAEKGSLLGSDGSAHTRLRDAPRAAFSPARVTALRPRIVEDVNALLDAMTSGGGPADLVERFALPLALHVVGELLGVPAGARERFRRWGDAFLSTSTASLDEAGKAQLEMGGYLAGLLAERRAAPRADLLSDMIAPDNEVRLDDQEVITVAIEIMLAGWETTAAAIAGFTYWLLTSSTDAGVSHYRHLADHPDQVERAVEELFRAIPIGAGDGLPRVAREDVSLGDVTVRAGDLVLASHDGAHLDEERFPGASAIDLTRHPNKHMAFGYGKHYCLGAALGRLETQIALAELLRRFPGLGLATPSSEVAFKTGTSIRGPVALLVRWDGARVTRR